MNRTLLSAILIMAVTAMNCFAAETQQVAATAAIPAASQALANPAPPAQQAPQTQAAPTAVSKRAEKASPIVETDSRQDGIAPQKSHSEEAALTEQSPKMQAANASAAGAPMPSASHPKTTSSVSGTGPKIRMLSQTAPTTSSTEAKTTGATSLPGRTTGGGCQTCKKKTQPTENPTVTDGTK
jgi:hypothetical protein